MSDFKAKTHQIFDFRWSSVADFAGGRASSALRCPNVFNKPTSKERTRKRKKGNGQGKKSGKEEKGKEMGWE